MDKTPASKRRYVMGAIAALTAVIAMPPVPMQAQQPRQGSMTLEALAAKVKQLEDTQEISNVLIAYGRALDSRDFKAFSSLFAKDGSWAGGLGSVSGGPQAIYDFMTGRIGGGRANNNGGGNANAGRGRQGGGAGAGTTYHIMSNFKIDLNGDTATASSRWTFVSAARGPGIQLAGRYEDTLLREGGYWKIKSRQAFNDVTGPTAAPAAGGAPPPSQP
jgi:hypothetical protein